MTNYPYCFLFAILIFTGCSKRDDKPRPVYLPDEPTTYIYKYWGERVPGSEISFTTDAPAGASYLWNFGDGTTSTLREPKHAYNDTGTYTIKLTVDDKEAYNPVDRLIILPGPLYTYKIASTRDWKIKEASTRYGSPDTLRTEYNEKLTLTYVDKVTVRLLNFTKIPYRDLVYQPAKSSGNVLAFASESGGGTLYFDHVADTMRYYWLHSWAGNHNDLPGTWEIIATAK